MTDPTAAADLVAFLGELTDPHKAGKVSAGQRQYTFLTLPDLLLEVRTTAARYHLGMTQTVATTDTGHTGLETVLTHASGERFTSGVWVMPDTPNPQAAGSQITYWRRYQLATFVGLAGSDDDDGAKATAHHNHAQEYAQTRPVERAVPDPAEDPYYEKEPPPVTGGAMSGFSGDMQATQKQLGAIRGMCGTLGLGQVRAGDFAHWLMKRDAPDRPDGLLLTKAEASHVIEVLKSDEAKALSAEFLGAMDLP